MTFPCLVSRLNLEQQLFYLLLHNQKENPCAAYRKVSFLDATLPVCSSLKLMYQRKRSAERDKKRSAEPDKIFHSKSCPAPGICQQSNVVYVATCILCGEFYVGMTTRKLHDPAREHVLSAGKRNNNTAMGDHCRERHNEKEQPTNKSSKKSKKSSGNESDKKKFKESPKINLRTIKHQPDLLRLHIEEPIAVKQLKPTLNNFRSDRGFGALGSSPDFSRVFHDIWLPGI